MAKRFTIESVFKAIDKITAPVSRMQSRVRKFTRSMSRSFHKLNRVVGKVASSIKRMATVGAASFVAMGFALGNLISTGAEFGRAIGSAAAKFPEQIKRGTKEFLALRKAARDVGATTEFTATQAAKGLNFLAKAGFDAKFSMRALAPIVDFATAAEIDLAEAADIASDALGAFGLDAKDPIQKMKNLERVMDVMSKTANSTNTSVSELFESAKKGGPIAVAAGSNIETFSAMMGFLASNGIKAAQAGTAAKNVTLALAGVGNKAAKTFGKLGIKLADSNGDMRDQLDVLDDLRKKLRQFGKKQQVEIIAAIFGKIPIAAASKLISKSGESIRGLRLELEKAGGSSKRTAAFIRNDVKGSIDGLTSAIEGVKISIFSLNEGPLKKTIDSMTEWVRTNEKLIATKIGNFLLSMINNLGNIWKWIKRVGIALAVFFAFTAALKTLVLVMTAFNLVMALNPIGLIVLGVVALIAAFTALVIWIDEISAGFDRLPMIIKVILGPIGLLIKAIKFIKDNFSVITGAASKIGSFLGLSGDDEDEKQQGITNAKVISPQERVARSIEENRIVNTAEVTIKDDTGRAEVTNGKLGTGITLQPTGTM